MPKFIKRLQTLLAGLLLVVTVFGSGLASADVYGSGGYGNCAYETDCPAPPTTVTPPPPTETQLPSGLKVAINLTQGQQIPEDPGYTITITPLNGQGKSFKSADIYINGQYITTQKPQSDGTVRWHWDPKQFPGSKVTIIITDQNGNKTTYEYIVSIVGSIKSGAIGITSGGGSFFHRISAKFAANVRKTLQALPGPVVYTLPYWIFIILLINALVLLLQAKREAAEKRTLDRLIAHEAAIVQAKANLIELVSHYIRTPLTLIRSGVEMLKAPAVPQELISEIQASVKDFSTKVEAVVSTNLDPLMQPDQPGLQKVSLWSRNAVLRLWLPVLLGGGFVFTFVYLANHMTSFSSNTADIITQVATFTLVVFASYQLYRRVVLRRQDKTNAESILSQEMIVNEARDKVIDEASLTLQAEIGKLKLVTGKLAAGNDTKFITKGQTQLEELTDRMIIASHLKGSHSSEAYSGVTAKSVFDRAIQKILPKAQAAGVDVELQQDSQLTTQNPGLLTLVVQSLIDNAVSYSKDKNKVTVSAVADESGNHVEVTDHGSGIEPGKLSQLFQPFFKAEGAEEFNHEGMGFSLYLDKIIMLYLGGDISVESTPNQSTVARLSWAFA